MSPASLPGRSPVSLGPGQKMPPHLHRACRRWAGTASPAQKASPKLNASLVPTGYGLKMTSFLRSPHSPGLGPTSLSSWPSCCAMLQRNRRSLTELDTSELLSGAKAPRLFTPLTRFLMILGRNQFNHPKISLKCPIGAICGAACASRQQGFDDPPDANRFQQSILAPTSRDRTSRAVKVLKI